MDGLLNILKSASNLDHAQLPKLIQALDDHQSFNKKASHEIDPVVSQISYQLNNVSSKYEGLLLLRAFLPQCSLDVIEQKGALWLTICTKVCVQKKPANAIQIAYDIINELLRRSVHIPDLAKAISSNLLVKIVESIVGVPKQCQLAALACLQLCMELYPGPCGSSRNSIERHLSTFVDQTDAGLVKEAGKCLLLLQQIRGGGNQGVSQKNAWALLQMQLLRTLHGNLDEMYVNTAETFDSGLNGNANGDGELQLKFPEIELSPEPITRATQLVTRFNNICQYLRTALLNPFPVPKQILPSRILALISRGLAVNCTTLAKNLITDNIAVGALIPQIHGALFQLLDALILVLGTHLLPHANNIIQLVIQSLKWTSSGKASGFKRPYSTIRQAAYNTLALWCKITKSGSFVETIADELIKYILQDVTPYQSEVTLKVLSGSRKYLSKKARQKLHKAQNDATNLAQTHSKAFNPHNTKIIYSDNGNEQLCAIALNCLNHILLTCGVYLKPVFHKIVQENIVAIAIVTVDGIPARSNLYFPSECRRNLYAVLNALVISPHHLCPPPVQYAVTVFTIAQMTDQNQALRENCADYLRTIEKLLHPQKESLLFPLDANEVADAFKKQNGKAQIGDETESSSDDEDMEVDLAHPTAQSSDTPSKVISIESCVTPATASPSPALNSASDAESITSIRSLRSLGKSVSRELSPATALSPPKRKSARLSSISESYEKAPGSPTARDTPRRRSTRISSISSNNAENVPTAGAGVNLTKIDEIQESVDVPGCSVDDITKLNASNEDDVVNQMAEAFVDEFLEDDSTD